jgi:hypothetical protein
VVFNFFVLGGDANRDRVVNFSDLLVLAANYNQAGRTFAAGDFNYDGAVGFSDLLILAASYNRSLTGTLRGNVAPAPSTSRRSRATDWLRAAAPGN